MFPSSCLGKCHLTPQVRTVAIPDRLSPLACLGTNPALLPLLPGAHSPAHSATAAEGHSPHPPPLLPSPVPARPRAFCASAPCALLLTAQAWRAPVKPHLLDAQVGVGGGLVVRSVGLEPHSQPLLATRMALGPCLAFSVVSRPHL